MAQQLTEILSFFLDRFLQEKKGKCLSNTVAWNAIRVKAPQQIFETGLIDETKNLLEKHGRIPNLVDTIGYREIIKYLDGEYDLKTACDMLKQNSRRYAKRQLTWFRANNKIKWNVYPDRKVK